MPTYKALSVRQPYAYLLVTGIKTCENRSWTTHHRGTLVIHAGAKPMTKEDWEWLDDIHKELGEPPPDRNDFLLRTGGIVGAVYLADVVTAPDPDWELGWWDGESLAWMISACQRVDEFLPLKGRLNLFAVELPYDIEWEEDEFYPQAKR
jgi:hypothetical protein